LAAKGEKGMKPAARKNSTDEPMCRRKHFRSFGHFLRISVWMTGRIKVRSCSYIVMVTYSLKPRTSIRQEIMDSEIMSIIKISEKRLSRMIRVSSFIACHLPSQVRIRERRLEADLGGRAVAGHYPEK